MIRVDLELKTKGTTAPHFKRIDYVFTKVRYLTHTLLMLHDDTTSKCLLILKEDNKYFVFIPKAL